MEELYEAIFQRFSVRTYQLAEPTDLFSDLEKKLADITPIKSHSRIDLVKGRAAVTKVLTGNVGRYGIISNPAGFLGFVGDTNKDHYLEEIGYQGEQAILWATKLGLGSCWVGGLFKPDKGTELLSPLGPNEKLIAIATLGLKAEGSKTNLKRRAMKFLTANRGKKATLSDVIDPLAVSTLPAPIVKGLEAVLVAPSAVNRQPWRFQLEGSNLSLYSTATNPTSTDSTRLDCGIAMCHFTIAAHRHGITGQWQLGPKDNNPIARFPLT